MIERLRAIACPPAWLATARACRFTDFLWKIGEMVPDAIPAEPEIRHWLYAEAPLAPEAVLEDYPECRGFAGVIAPSPDRRLRDLAVSRNFRLYSPENFPIYPATPELPERWRGAPDAAGAVLTSPREILLAALARGECRAEAKDFFGLAESESREPVELRWLTRPPEPEDIEATHRLRALTEQYQDRCTALTVAARRLARCRRNSAWCLAWLHELCDDLGRIRAARRRLRRELGSLDSVPDSGGS